MIGDEHAPPRAEGGGGEEAADAGGAAPPYPWEAEEAPDDPDAPRQRHDAFTAAKKTRFLSFLVKEGCIVAAARRTGISARTVYRHQESDAQFARWCGLALGMAGTPLELTAWQRAVEGVEEPFACGGQVHYRRRYSESLLRLLLQASNPKKYGPRPGFSRKRLMKHEKKRMAREIRAELEETMQLPSPEAVRASIVRKVAAVRRHHEAERRAAGWTQTPEGHWIPPGYAPIPGWQPASAAAGPSASAERPKFIPSGAAGRVEGLGTGGEAGEAARGEAREGEPPRESL